MIKVPSPEDIRSAAAAKGLTMTRVCRLADTSDRSWYRWANNPGTGISTKTLQRLVDTINAAETVPLPPCTVGDAAVD